MRHRLFARGGVDTSFLAHHLHECLPVPTPAPAAVVALAAVAAALRNIRCDARAASAGGEGHISSQFVDIWASGNAGRPATPMAAQMAFNLIDHAAADVAAAAPTASAPAAVAGVPGLLVAHVSRASVAPHRLPSTASGAPIEAAFSVQIARPGAASSAKEASPSVAVTAATMTAIDEDVASSSALPGHFSASTTGRRAHGVSAQRIVATLGGVATVKATIVFVADVRGGGAEELWIFPEGGSLSAAAAASAAPISGPFVFTLPTATFGAGAKGVAGAASTVIVTPMPGKVVKVRVLLSAIAFAVCV